MRMMENMRIINMEIIDHKWILINDSRKMDILWYQQRMRVYIT